MVVAWALSAMVLPWCPCASRHCYLAAEHSRCLVLSVLATSGMCSNHSGPIILTICCWHCIGREQIPKQLNTFGNGFGCDGTGQQKPVPSRDPWDPMGPKGPKVPWMPWVPRVPWIPWVPWLFPWVLQNKFPKVLGCFGISFRPLHVASPTFFSSKPFEVRTLLSWPKCPIKSGVASPCGEWQIGREVESISPTIWCTSTST